MCPIFKKLYIYYTYIDTHTYIHTCMHTHAYTHMYTCTCICTHIYIYICIELQSFTVMPKWMSFAMQWIATKSCYVWGVIQGPVVLGSTLLLSQRFPIHSLFWFSLTKYNYSFWWQWLKQGFEVKRPEVKTPIHTLLAMNIWEIYLIHLIAHLLIYKVRQHLSYRDFVRIKWSINLHSSHSIINAQKVPAKKKWSFQLIMLQQLVTPILTPASYQ